MKSFFKHIFRLPTWVIFFILVVPIFINITSLGLIIASFVLILWLLAIYMSLKNEIPKEIKINSPWFVIRLIYAFFYIVALEVLFNGNVTSFLMPFHVVAVLSIFSCLFSVSMILVICKEICYLIGV